MSFPTRHVADDVTNLERFLEGIGQTYLLPRVVDAFREYEQKREVTARKQKLKKEKKYVRYFFLTNTFARLPAVVFLTVNGYVALTLGISELIEGQKYLKWGVVSLLYAAVFIFLFHKFYTWIEKMEKQTPWQESAIDGFAKEYETVMGKPMPRISSEMKDLLLALVLHHDFSDTRFLVFRDLETLDEHYIVSWRKPNSEVLATTTPT